MKTIKIFAALLALEFSLSFGVIQFAGAQPTNSSAPAAATDIQKELPGGIGATLDSVENQLKVGRVVPDGPAFKAGLKSGQLITAINRQSVAGMSVVDAVKRVRGAVGTQVELMVKNPGDATSHSLVVTREIVKIPANVIGILTSRAGMMKMYTFQPETIGEIRSGLQGFKNRKVRGVIIDLRDNSGGSPVAMEDIAGYFVGTNAGLWKTLVVGETKPEVMTSRRTLEYDGPVAVLISTNTAGGELFAAAMQANHRAKLIGQPTSGTTRVTAVMNKPDGTSKAVVYSHFFTMADQPIEKGVKPDIVLDPGLSETEVLAKAVESLKQ